MSKIEGQQGNNLEQSGDAINIAQHGQPATHSVSPGTGNERVLGIMRGQIHWTEGWEKPLSDDEADAFLEGRYLRTPSARLLTRAARKRFRFVFREQ